MSAALRGTVLATDAGLATLAGIAATVLEQDILPPAPGPQDYTVLYDLRRDLPRALALQAACLAGGHSALFIGFEPGLVQIGPHVRPGHIGCLRCWRERRDSNHASPRHGAGFAPRPGASAHAAISPVMRRLLQLLIAQPIATGSYMRVRTGSLEVSRHRFEPVTACPGCHAATVPRPRIGAQFMQPRLKHRATDKRIGNPRLTLARARRQFVDRHSGLVKHVFLNQTSDLMPLCSAEMALPGRQAIESGYGRAEDFQTSELVAILEAVERYAGLQARGGQASLRGSVAAMQTAWPGQVTDPEQFILHTEQQLGHPAFGLARYSPQLPFQWCWAHSLRHGAPRLVPEQLVYYHLPDAPERPVNRFVYDSSNGCAMGGCLEEAALSGLYEIVERDAYFATWYLRRTPPRIANHSIGDSRSAALIARAQAEGMEIHLFDITTDAAIPAVWAMIVDPSADAVVKSYCASACHGRWNEAVFSALVEVVTSMGVYRRSMAASRERAMAMLRDSDLVRDMPDHVLLYSLPESYPRLDFLHGGPVRTLQQCEASLPSLSLPDLSEELRRQAARVLEVAHDVLVIDQGFDSLAPLGLHCAKVLVPGLLPVTFGHQYRRIGYARLNRLARFYGLEQEYTPDNINPFPHNFP